MAGNIVYVPDDPSLRIVSRQRLRPTELSQKLFRNVLHETAVK